MTQLAIFIILTMANVILSTAKSLITINGDKWSAAFANAVTYGVYTYLIFFTALDGVELWQKALITFICNFVGVLLVKVVEEKLRKDRLWIFQATAKTDRTEIQTIYSVLKEMGIKLVYNEVVKDELYSIQIFSNTQKESTMIKSVLENYNVKYCAVETKKKKKKRRDYQSLPAPGRNFQKLTIDKLK